MVDTLVLSGGGYSGGLKAIGVIKSLIREKVISLDSINNIYGISAGAIVASMLLTMVDFDEITNYVIDRPWGSLVEMTPDMIFGMFKRKGLFNKNIFTEIMRPLLNSKGLSCDITLKEFFEFNRKTLKIYTLDINSNKIIEFSYKSHPDYKLIDCIHCSACIPTIFEPSIVDDKCYIDPACVVNYPIKYALEDGIEKDRILGLICMFDADMEAKTVTSGTNIIDFMSFILKRLLYDTRAYENIKNEVFIEMEVFSLISLVETFKKRERYENSI